MEGERKRKRIVEQMNRLLKAFAINEQTDRQADIECERGNNRKGIG